LVTYIFWIRLKHGQWNILNKEEFSLFRLWRKTGEWRHNSVHS